MRHCMGGGVIQVVGSHEQLWPHGQREQPGARGKYAVAVRRVSIIVWDDSAGDV